MGLIRGHQASQTCGAVKLQSSPGADNPRYVIGIGYNLGGRAVDPCPMQLHASPLGSCPKVSAAI